MAGSRLLLTERDQTIIREVNRLGALTREHLTALGHFASKTRANERLKRLVDEELLASRRQPLHAGGPRLVYLPLGTERLRNSSAPFLAHQLGVVDVRVAFEIASQVSRWLTDQELRAFNLGVIPDGCVEYSHEAKAFCAFLEYDRQTETVERVVRKVRAYLALAFSGRFEKEFHHKYFRLLLVVDSPGRLANLSAAIVRVSDKVTRLALLRDVKTRGPLAPIWQRPGSKVCESLTQ